MYLRRLTVLRSNRGVAAIVALALLVGCSGLDSDPITLVNHLRVLAIHADPPYIAGPGSSMKPGFGAPTRIEPLVVGAEEPDKLCYAWVLCPFALSKDGNFRCLDESIEVDLGTKRVAHVGALEALAAFSKLKELGDKVGTGISIPGGGAPGGGAPGGGAGSGVALEVFIQFMISEASVWGGVCPTNARQTLHKVCPKRQGCLAGYSKLAFATSPLHAHHNPVLKGLTLDKVLWPANATPTTAPEADDGASNPFDIGTVGLALEPTWTADSIEVVRPAQDGQPEVVESLTFSWYSTNGDFSASKTSQYFADNRFKATGLESGGAEDVRIWLVARDNRNGLAWLRRNVRVTEGAKPTMHVLCRLKPELAGCEKAEPCLGKQPPDPGACSKRCQADDTLPWCTS